MVLDELRRSCGFRLRNDIQRRPAIPSGKPVVHRNIETHIGSFGNPAFARYRKICLHRINKATDSSRRNYEPFSDAGAFRGVKDVGSALVRRHFRLEQSFGWWEMIKAIHSL